MFQIGVKEYEDYSNTSDKFLRAINIYAKVVNFSLENFFSFQRHFEKFSCATKINVYFLLSKNV